MKLRVALKIAKAIGTPDEARYSGHQIRRAQARLDRTRSSKEVERFYREMMTRLGVDGRVRLLNQLGHAGDAFDLYMRQGR